jgi:hypothetical protein
MMAFRERALRLWERPNSFEKVNILKSLRWGWQISDGAEWTGCPNTLRPRNI